MTEVGGEQQDEGGRWPHLSRRRAPLAKAAMLAAGVLAIATGGSRAVRWRQQRSAVARLSESLGSYAECMIGAPLEPGETARARLRRVEAGLPEVSVADGLPAIEPWPVRCRDDLDRAHAALASGALRGGDATTRLDQLVITAIKDPSPADAPDLVDDLFRAAPLAGVSAVPRRYPPVSRHLAPPPASPLSASQLVPLPIPVRALPDELPGEDPLALGLAFLDAKEAPWTCAFDPLHGEPLREVRCAERKRAALSVPREDTAHGPGYLRTARERFDRFELVRPVPDANPDVTALPSSIQTVALYGDALVWVTNRRWYARTVTPGRAPLGEPVDLGEVSGASPELEACPTRTALLVGLKTFDEALVDRRSWRAMAAREAGEWQRTPGRSVVDVAATFTCQGHAGTWTWFDRRVVTQARCTADRCETHTSDRLALAWDVGASLFAADLGGRALLLGLGTTPGPLTGRSVTSVRMRMAPLAAITNASDAVLFSDAAHDGASVSNVGVYVRDGIALVLMRLSADDPLPYRAIRVDALGVFAPMLVAN